MTVTTAVVLARGLGTRMRRSAGRGGLTAAQAAAAARGAKAMMPTGGRPFLDFVLTSLADAGVTDVALVVGPDHASIRSYYDKVAPTRLRVSFAVQDEPRGTADAVAAAEAFVAGRHFLSINGDNHYASETLRSLCSRPGTAMAGYDRGRLAAGGNIPLGRIAAYALIEEREGVLIDMIEKPSPAHVAARPDALVSMNCYVFTPAIFEACCRIAPSLRGEYEIVDAVRDLVDQGERVQVVPTASSVLDLSGAGDLATIERIVAGWRVSL